MRLALESLRGLRYQGNGYVFVDSFDMVLLMHPNKPEKQGSDRSVETDGRGKLFMRDLIQATQANGSAFVDYLFKDPKGGDFDKLSYAQAFGPWGWTIASGVLLTDVQAIFNQAALTSGVTSLGIILVLLVMGGLIVRGTARPMTRLNQDMLQIADGKFDVIPQGQDRQDEIGAMSRPLRCSARTAKRLHR